MCVARCQPFENKVENWLQTYAQGVIFLTLSIGGMLQTSTTDNNNAVFKTAQINEDAVSAVLIIINCSVFAFIITLAWLNRPKNVLMAIKGKMSKMRSVDEDTKERVSALSFEAVDSAVTAAAAPSTQETAIERVLAAAGAPGS